MKVEKRRTIFCEIGLAGNVIRQQAPIYPMRRARIKILIKKTLIFWLFVRTSSATARWGGDGRDMGRPSPAHLAVAELVRTNNQKIDFFF